MKYKDNQINNLTNVYLSIPMSKLSVITVSFPLCSLFFCFITSLLTKFDEVNETVCGVSI